MHIFINQIFLNDPFDQHPGNVVPLYITFENDGKKDLDNTKIIVSIPELGARAAAIGPLDLNVGRQVTRFVLLELPDDIVPGTYSVRLQVYHENRQRVVHREIEIVDHS